MHVSPRWHPSQRHPHTRVSPLGRKLGQAAPPAAVPSERSPLPTRLMRLTLLRATREGGGEGPRHARRAGQRGQKQAKLPVLRELAVPTLCEGGALPPLALRSCGFARRSCNGSRRRCAAARATFPRAPQTSSWKRVACAAGCAWVT